MFHEDGDYFCCTLKKAYRKKPTLISSLSRRLKGLNFNGKRVLISHVNPGFSGELAISFSRLGADVGLVGHNEKELHAIAQKCTGGNSIVLKANLHKKNVAHTVVSTFIAEFGGIDVLVNFTPLFAYGTIETTSMQQFDKIMNSNLRAIYNLTMKSVPELIASQGCIINISSSSGSRAVPNCIAFCIAKAALDQFSKALAVELGPQGVRSVTISPSVIETKFNKMMGIKCCQFMTFVRNMKKAHALRRVGKYQDLINVVIYAASDVGKFLTGSNWMVDGGYGLTPITSHNFASYFFPDH